MGSRPFNFAFLAFVLIVSLTDSLVKKLKLKKLTLGSRDGVVMIKLASHPGSGHEWVKLVVGSLLCSESEVFLRVLRFSPLLKNEHFQIPIRSNAGLLRKPLWGEWIFLSKYQ